MDSSHRSCSFLCEAAYSQTAKDLPLQRREMLASRQSERNQRMFHRILVPLDGSKHAELAAPAAARLARASGGSIVLAHIVPAIAALESDQQIEVTMTQETRLVAHADTYLR